MCGLDYMLACSQAPRSTVLRWLKKLRDDGLIVTVEKAAGSAAGRKGKRAVYEIQVPPGLAARAAAQLSQVSLAETRVGESGLTGADQTPPRVRSQRPGPDPAEAGSQVPSAVRPPLPRNPDRHQPVEGASRRSGQDRGDEEGIQSIVAPERAALRAGGSGGIGIPPGSCSARPRGPPPATCSLPGGSWNGCSRERDRRTYRRAGHPRHHPRARREHAGRECRSRLPARTALARCRLRPRVPGRARHTGNERPARSRARGLPVGGLTP